MFNIKKITAGIMTALLLTGTLGMAVSAQSTVTTKSAFTITKNLVMDQNVTNFPEFTFTFDVEPIDTQGEYDAINGTYLSALKKGETQATDEEKSDLIVLEGVPALADVTVNYTGTEPGTVKDNIRTVTAQANVSLDGQNFTKPGLYLYELTEKHLGDADWTKKSDTDKLLKQSEEKFILAVAVVNNEGGTGVEVSTRNSFVICKEAGTDTYKKGEAVFENTYQRGSEDPDNFDLKIAKKVTGNFGDTEKDFEFQITINKNATELAEVNSYTAEKWKVGGTAKIEDVAITVGETKTFTLKNDEYLLFKDLPVGSTYTLKEINNTGYVTTVNAKVRGTDNAVETVEGATNEAFAARTNTIGQGENSVEVTNNADMVLTGIVTDNLSFILLIVVAVAGMTAYVVLKRRMRSR